MSRCRECGGEHEGYSSRTTGYEHCLHHLMSELRGLESMVTSGWTKLSDVELATWYSAGNPLLLNGFGPSELERRGIRVADCPECGRKGLMHQHEYLCILCRHDYA